MIKRIFTLCIALTASVASITAATVTINSYNFPDVKFRAYLKTADFNSNGDNELTDAEIKNATMLEVNEKGITNLKGIEYFTSMWFLDCSDNDLQSLDVSKNTALTMLACANNKLKSLDVSKNTNLGFLACYNNKLTSLDLSKNTALSELDCFLNQIKGESMDALIASLPNGTDCEFVAVSDGDLEQNVCTGPQAAAAKQKGWNLSCWYCNSFVANPFEGGVTINEYNFPDVTFRSEVLSLDTDADGMLSDKDIQAVTHLDVREKGIKNLKGIEYFTALTGLLCSYNSLESLDVSKNTALTVLYCTVNDLKSLDVSKNTALTKLYCEWNSLESLDVSKNTALTVLYCTDNDLKSLDVSKNTALTKLYCNSNGLKSLDVSNNTALTYLDCYNNGLKSLDVTKNTALTTLHCEANQIKGSSMDNLVNGLPDTQGTLIVCDDGFKTDNVITRAQVKVATDKGWKVQKYTKDENNKWVYVDYAGVSVDIPIDATNFPDEKFRNYLLSQDYGKDAKLTEEEIEAITKLDVSLKGIKDLTGIGHFTALTELYCYSNSLQSLDVSKNTALTELWCFSNGLKSLDVTKNTALTLLDCYNNGLESLDVSKNTALTYLDCYYNSLESLDVSKNTALTYLSCNNNSLKSLDVSNNTALEVLYCYKNGLKSLDVSKNTMLLRLECYDNGLESLDVTNNTALTKLYCNSNGLKSLDVTKNTALTYLDCSENSLKSLDVSKNTALRDLICSDNKLVTLDVSSNTSLEELYCSDNMLSQLDLSKNTALKMLDCHLNQIKGAQMDALISSLPTVEDRYFCVLSPTNDIETELNVCTTTQMAAAKKKGWKVVKYYVSVYVLYGDVYKDGVINKDDLDQLVKLVMGLIDENDNDLWDVDVNNDGKVDAADIVALVNILNGK